MQGQGIVFVTGDRLGDQLTSLLEAEGCQIIRGPKPNPQNHGRRGPGHLDIVCREKDYEATV
jgi:hypothetical protein